MIVLLIIQIILISNWLTKTEIFINHTNSIIHGQKRELQSFITPELSRLSGNGTTSFNAEEQVVITVATYDWLNSAINSGGAIFTLELNEYDASNILVTSTNYTFTDNNDGTYTIVFTVNQDGSIQYNIYANSSCTACSYYWTNMDLSGDYTYFCNFNDLSRTFGHGEIMDGYTDYVSARVETRFIAPATATYTFTCEHDDGCIIIINGTTIINLWSTGVFTTSGTI